MRQVPKYLIIGSGRMARHFCYYLQLLNLPYLQWSRANNTTQQLAEYSKNCTHTLLLISDRAIGKFLIANTCVQPLCCVHFSGCLTVENIYSAHPVMTFGPKLYDLETYRTIPFTLEEGDSELADLLPGLPNQSYKIDPSQKPLYHALLCMGNNFTTLLWQHLFTELQTTLTMPAEIVQPLLKQTLTNLLTIPDAALTGPLARNDQRTIESHISALQDDSYQAVYQAFVDVFKKINPGV